MKAENTVFFNFTQAISDEERELIYGFFSEFDAHFSLSKREREKFRRDFEAAITELYNRGVTVEESLERLALTNLGGFYARPAVMWFPLDDAAKIYPIAMEHGRQQVYRLSVYFKEPVIPELVQMALTFTIKRFPCFATTLKKGFFWHYLDAVKKHFGVEKEEKVPCRPIKVSRSGSQPFRIIYYNNRVSAEFFHALTDGTGAMTFFKVLISEYLRLLGVKPEQPSDIWDANASPTGEEFENAFLGVEKAKQSSGFVDKAALQMTGRLAKTRPCRILHFKMDSQKLLEVAKKNGATVTAYLLMQMFYACQASTEELVGDFSIQVPVNMRKYYPTRSVRNFSMYCGVRVPIEDIGDRETLLAEISSQLAEKSSKDKMQQMITAAVKLVSSIRLVPLVIKQPIAKLVYGFLGEKIFTTTFSNLGVVSLPSEFSGYVESMDCCLGPQTTNRLACTAVSCGGVSTFTISKMTADRTFEERMYKLLTDDGLEVSVEGSEYYDR